MIGVLNVGRVQWLEKLFVIITATSHGQIMVFVPHTAYLDKVWTNLHRRWILAELIKGEIYVLEKVQVGIRFFQNTDIKSLNLKCELYVLLIYYT